MSKRKMLVLTGGPNHDFEHAQRRLTELLSPAFEVETGGAAKDLQRLHVDTFSGAVIFTCEMLDAPMGFSKPSTSSWKAAADWCCCTRR